MDLQRSSKRDKFSSNWKIFSKLKISGCLAGEEIGGTLLQTAAKADEGKGGHWARKGEGEV